MPVRLPAILDWVFNRHQRRSLDAAGGGRRWADDRQAVSPGVVYNGAATIAARAQHFALKRPSAPGSPITSSAC